jgi:hypothetical protein
MNKWIISLNDGQRLSEDTLKEQIGNESNLSPWLLVMDYLHKNPSKEITHIELNVNGRHYNSPSIGKSARFRNDIEPADFWICRRMLMFMMGGSGQQEYISFSYRVGEYRHFLWVNTQTNETYVELKGLDNSLEADIANEYNGIKQRRIDAGIS